MDKKDTQNAKELTIPSLEVLEAELKKNSTGATTAKC